MNDYKKWLIKFILILSLYSIFYTSIVYFSFSTPQFCLWVKNCIEKKEKIAAKIKTKKIIFASGSNTLFGIRTRDIQKTLNIPCVNMGTHIDLYDYLLYRVKKSAKKGDIIILPLEYEFYEYDGKYSQLKSFYIRTYDRQYFYNQPVSEQLYNVFNTNFFDLINSIREVITFRNLETDSGYNSKTLNKNGDETNNIGIHIDKIKVKLFKLSDNQFRITFGLKLLSDFNKWCKNNGIIMYITYPSLLYSPEYYTNSYKDYFDNLNEFLKNNNIRTLGTPYDFIYPDRYFYDAKYHLNSDGMTLRTNRLIQLMRDNNLVISPMSLD